MITESKFKTFGCGSAIASSSVATEWLKGRSVDDSLKIKNTDIAGHLKLPPVKLHCRLAEYLESRAILAALAQVVAIMSLKATLHNAPENTIARPADFKARSFLLNPAAVIPALDPLEASPRALDGLFSSMTPPGTVVRLGRDAWSMVKLSLIHI